MDKFLLLGTIFKPAIVQKSNVTQRDSRFCTFKLHLNIHFPRQQSHTTFRFRPVPPSIHHYLDCTDNLIH